MPFSERTRRIGMIVPSSNVTMETEIPALLKAREHILPDRFTFHSSRMRMKSVIKEELEAMDADSKRCAQELSDAAVEVQAYACLVAIMSMGLGYHRTSSETLYQATVDNGCPTPILNSAGALVDGIQELGAKKVAIICPYMRPLTEMVVNYIENEGIEVHDFLALEIPDNLAVAAQDPCAPAELWRKLDLTGVDAIVASACVQMPSLPSIEMIERASGLPTLSAAVATTRKILQMLNLSEIAPGGGALLSGGLPSKRIQAT
ncbi:MULTISPECIES: Asp/Glu racemase [Thalassospira]|uniref:Maleate isomerase n=2 Tax=Thalassospira TaxID=168934 RepID=A0A367WAF6_9PROT|nr:MULTISPECIES: Asp/Glu racemase [Thalassospira]MDG4719997.1 Asp/Glu racemase [Thalassospira sp. FZY0004]RCK38435.1 Asp/Glu racemase [Thalassospira profundimaris]